MYLWLILLSELSISSLYINNINKASHSSTAWQASNINSAYSRIKNHNVDASLLAFVGVAEEGKVVVVEAGLHGQRAFEKVNAVRRSAEVEVGRGKRDVEGEVHIFLEVDLENGLVHLYK